MVGPDARMLGIRTPADIQPDGNGDVHPDSGGMSVAPRLADLPPHRIPRRLRAFPGLATAAGSNALWVWRMGDGDFVPSPITSVLALSLHPADARHGLLECFVIMSLRPYRSGLAETRPEWEIEEPTA